MFPGDKLQEPQGLLYQDEKGLPLLSKWKIIIMSVSRSRDYNKSLQKQDHDDNNDNGQKSPASFVMSTLLSAEKS